MHTETSSGFSGSCPRKVRTRRRAHTWPSDAGTVGAYRPCMTTNAWHPDEDPQSDVDPRVDNEAVEAPVDEMGMNPDA